MNTAVSLFLHAFSKVRSANYGATRPVRLAVAAAAVAAVAAATAAAVCLLSEATPRSPDAVVCLPVCLLLYIQA